MRLTFLTRSAVRDRRSRLICRRSSCSGVGAFAMAQTRGSPRDTAVKARAAAIITLKAVLVTVSDELRIELESLTDHKLIIVCAALETNGNMSVPHVATRYTLAHLAQRWLDLHEEIKVHGAQLKVLTKTAAPKMLEQFGVGFDTAAEVLIAAEGTDRPMRLYSELSSSDCDGTRLPSPMLNVAKPTDFQRRTSSDPLSASSPENATTFFPNLLFPLNRRAPLRRHRKDLTVYRSINALAQRSPSRWRGASACRSSAPGCRARRSRRGCPRSAAACRTHRPSCPSQRRTGRSGTRRRRRGCRCPWRAPRGPRQSW